MPIAIESVAVVAALVIGALILSRQEPRQAKIFDDVDVSVSGGVLKVSMKPAIEIPGNGVFKLIPTCPQTVGVSASGAARFYVGGLTVSTFTVAASGASAVTISNGSVSRLDLRASGATRIDTRTVRAKSVRVSAGGSSTVLLQVDGGSLSCTASGASRVAYHGSVSDQRISLSGVAGVSSTN